MSEPTYSLIFRGDLIAGFTAGDVKANLARLFKSSPQAVEKLFSGRPLILRKGLGRAQAEQFQATLAKIGAQATVKDESGAVVAKSKPAPKSQASEPQEKAQPEAPDWTLAPMEGHLLKDYERKQASAVQVSTDHISLRAAEGLLLDKNERVEPEAAVVNIPQWDVD
ncbi:hypothetical protein [Microbulbifer sp. GL-2]|uniref:hypothetical protein n=1 Tax=Microbulbifer sp. GL-2 TaxID=2591606 RepID=UPI001164BD8E|nr:hypothetical protein [Microbulbifer sp. GL-2]BBM02109.1 hypothetical protein GL2_21830 [Microbulbifer sp. GL-2]